MKSRDLKDSEIALILEHLPSLRDRCLFILGIKTGFRISELLSLTVKDILDQTTNHGLCSIKDTLTVKRQDMKGKHSSRTVPLHPDAKYILEEYLRSFPDNGMLTSLTKGDLYMRLFPIGRYHAWRVIKQAALDAGIPGPISTHSMRKSFGMKVYNHTGKNVVAAQRALGHKSLASTGHYLSIGEDEINEAILA